MHTTRTQAAVIFFSFVLYTIAVSFIGFAYGMLYERNNASAPTYNLVIQVQPDNSMDGVERNFSAPVPDAGPSLNDESLMTL